MIQIHETLLYVSGISRFLQLLSGRASRKHLRIQKNCAASKSFLRTFYRFYFVNKLTIVNFV